MSKFFKTIKEVRKFRDSCEEEGLSLKDIVEEFNEDFTPSMWTHAELLTNAQKLHDMACDFNMVENAAAENLEKREKDLFDFIVDAIENAGYKIVKS